MKNKPWFKWIFPIIHGIIGILCSNVLFVKNECPYAVPMQVYPSFWTDEAERIVHVGMSNIYGLLMIFLLWKIIFMLIEQKKILPFFLFFVSVVVSVFVFPGNYFYEPDNLTNYAYAVRNISDYWQNVHVGYLYRGCMVVFPHPITLTILQLTGLLGGICYIFYRCKRIYGKKMACMVWLAVFLPEFMEVGLNPYRNCFYTIMCLWYFALLFFDCLEQKTRNKKELILICVAGGFLAMFRSEGIVLLLLVFCAMLFLYKQNIKRSLAYFVACALVFSVLILPQKLGEQKYYGNEYSIINTMNMLKTILADENANYAYEGAGEDLSVIHSVVALDELAVYGIHAYRADNFTKYGTINQSCSSIEMQEKFVDSAYSILGHNFDLFLKDRLFMFCEANGVMSEAEDPYPTEEWNNMYLYLASQWNYAYGEILTDSYPTAYFMNRENVLRGDRITDFFTDYYNFFCSIRVVLISRLVVFLLFPLLACYAWIKAKKERSFMLGAALVLMMQLAAIMLACPEGRGVYYYPLFYVMLLGCFLLCLDISKNNTAVNKMLPPVINKLGIMP